MNACQINYPARDRLSRLRDITRPEISALIYQTLVAINRAKEIDSPYIV
jgi:DNA-binding TFAR19-related protein (PDSD5 family)